jgi:hypothetical protein
MDGRRPMKRVALLISSVGLAAFLHGCAETNPCAHVSAAQRAQPLAPSPSAPYVGHRNPDEAGELAVRTVDWKACENDAPTSLRIHRAGPRARGQNVGGPQFHVLNGDFRMAPRRMPGSEAGFDGTIRRRRATSTYANVFLRTLLTDGIDGQIRRLGSSAGAARPEIVGSELVQGQKSPLSRRRWVARSQPARR